MEETGGAETRMNFNMTDEMVSQFLSGLVPILALIAVGTLLAILLKGMNKRFAFTRLALILALPPLSLIHFLEPSITQSLYLFVMILTLLGITVDGINHLLMPKERPAAPPAKKAGGVEATAEPEPEVIVWEKAQ